jgi:hypothetical protein
MKRIPPDGGCETQPEYLSLVHAPDSGLWKTSMTGHAPDYRRRMRWDNLFDDLESQLEHELSAEDVDVRAEEERLRLGRLGLRDRVVAISAHTPAESIRFALIDGQSIVGRLTSHGRDWFFVEQVSESLRRSHSIIPLAAVASVVLTLAQVEASVGPTAPGDNPGAGFLGDRLGLTFVLRDICRRRSAVEVRTLTGVYFGTIDRVGKDHLDLAEHERGAPRRSSAVAQFRMIPLVHIAIIAL